MSAARRKRLTDLENSPGVGTPKRRRTKADRNAEQIGWCHEIFEVLKDHKTLEGKTLTEWFLRAPSRRTDPKYYEVVTQPMDFARIQQKLKMDEYKNFDEFVTDVELLIGNNKSYYTEECDEQKVVNELETVFAERRERQLNGCENKPIDASPAPSSRMSMRSASPNSNSRMSAQREPLNEKIVEDIVASILDLTDDSGRLLSPPFRVLQSREEFPTYYEKITEPIDLKMIAEKARAGSYSSFSQLDTDIRLLCKNAKVFNEPGSVIHRDSTSILRFFTKKVKEANTGHLDSLDQQRIDYNKEMIDNLIAQSSSSMGIEEFSEDSEEDEDTETAEDARWKLYWTIRNEPDENDSDSNLADPFLELPQKSYYPDYYDEIEKPVSLFLINKKLKRSEYTDVESLVADLIQMFENACSYNMEGSEIYKAARKLQRLTLSTVRRLVHGIDITKFKISQESEPTTSPVVTPGPKKRAKKEVASDDESDKSDEKERKPRRKKQMVVSTGLTPSVSTPGKPGRKSLDELQLRYRINLAKFWQHLYELKENDDYWPIGAFMELPARKEYPDYYEVIKDPIDMKKIMSKIENNGYASSDELIADFALMFDNCREYNEPGSQLHNDANRLEATVRHLHSTTPGTPFRSPLALKEQFGWHQTNLSALGAPRGVRSEEEERKRKEERKQLRKERAGLEEEAEYVRPPPIVHHAFYFMDCPPPDFALRSPFPPPHMGVHMNNHHNQAHHTPVKAQPKTPKAVSNMQGKTPEQQKMWSLYNELLEYKDHKGRQIAELFRKLPNKQEMPDYYEVIKKPMDFSKVQYRLTANGYASPTEFVADLTLMFDNACKYNEPDSQVYKDAVTLASVVITRKREWGAEEAVPRVQVQIRAILTNIFAAIFNKKGADDRCFSDSLSELPDLLKAMNVPKEKWPFSFEQIKKNIDKCRYRRLDRFQKDFFDLFEMAREYSGSDSQMFEDAAALQLAFIKERDERCKGLISSRAFLVVENTVIEQIALQKHKKAKQETEDDRKADKEASASQSNQFKEGEQELDALESNGTKVELGDFVYVAPTAETSKHGNHIMRVERIYKDSDGTEMVRGRWVFRPHETFHRKSRKFIENEVFLTNSADMVVAERICGKCTVLFLPTYLKKVPKAFTPEDTYVCEFKYLGRQLHFKKLKDWPYDDSKIELEERTEPVELKRVPSVFVREDSTSEETSSVDEDDCCADMTILDVDRPEVATRNGEDADGRTYFQQLVSSVGGKTYALGNFVLVFNPQRAYCDVMRIDKLWREADGKELFSGGWFARPADVSHDSGRMFYLREVFAVSQPDQTRNVSDIQSKCAVLIVKDAVRVRPTEIPECDVYVCESRVEGHGGQGDCSLFNIVAAANSEEKSESTAVPMHIDHCRKVRTFKSYSLSAEIAEEELFYFKTQIVMDKEMSPLVAKNEVPPIDLDAELEEADTDGTESTVGCATPQPGELKSWLSAQPKLNAKSKSGYILFSAEIRKRIMHENPDAGFGEVSKIVGVEWKKLTEDQKKQYEVRADYIATERAKQEQVAAASAAPLNPNQCKVWMCKWLSCEFMCDHGDGLYDHLVHHHTAQIIPDSEQQYVCMWGQCVRNRKEGKPFPSLPRLHRHIKEKHMASAAKVIYQNQRGRTFYRYVPAQTEGGSGQLLHYPFGMHPSQVAQAQSQGSMHLPPQVTNQQHVPHQGVQINGDAHHGHPRTNGTDPAHYQVQVQQQHQTPSTAHSQHHGGVAYQSAPGPSHVSHAQAHPPQPQPHPAQIADPGRTVVMVARGVEPVFVPAPGSVQVKRVLHTDAYLRYIESLNSRQRTVSKYERCLAANRRNTQAVPATQRSAPYNWIKSSKSTGRSNEDDAVAALWKLRDQLLESTTNVSREYQGPL